MSAERIADPVQMEVFSNRLLAIAEDMGSILIRSSFSSNIKERRDCSTALFDATGRLIAQADHIPIHLGAMIGAVETDPGALPARGMKPGDAFIAQRPLSRRRQPPARHLDHHARSIMTAQVRFFCGNIAHHADVGGTHPGLDLGHLALDLRGGHPHPGHPHRARRARSTRTCSS